MKLRARSRRQASGRNGVVYHTSSYTSLGAGQKLDARQRELSGEVRIIKRGKKK